MEGAVRRAGKEGAPARPPTRPRPLHEHSAQLFSVVTIVLVVHFFIFIKALKLLARAVGLLGTGDIARVARLAALVSVEAAVLSSTFYVLWATCCKRLPLRHGPDWTLLIGGCLIPLAQLGYFFTPFEGFEVDQKNWPAFYAIMLASGASVGEFPPSHQLVQWLFTTPAFM